MAIDRPSPENFQEVCQHGNMPKICPICLSEALRPSMKENLETVLRNLASPEAADALRQVASMPEEEIRRVAYEAAAAVMDPVNTPSHLLGGGFVGDRGELRGRETLDLEAQPLVERYPFLAFLAIKLIRPTIGTDREIRTHLRLQEAVRKIGDNALRIPSIVDVKYIKESREIGIVIERLPISETDNSLQMLFSRAKRDRVRLFVSSEVTDSIHDAFQAMHKLGFIHGDVNDGNVFLLNTAIREYALPQEPEKRRPPTIRVITGGDVVLLDFERTKSRQDTDLAVDRDAFDAEDDLVTQMTEGTVLDANEDYDAEEMAEAYDDLRESTERFQARRKTA